MRSISRISAVLGLAACARHTDGAPLPLTVRAAEPSDVQLGLVVAALRPCPRPSLIPTAYAHTPSTADTIGAPLVFDLGGGPVAWGTFDPGVTTWCGLDVMIGAVDADTPGALPTGIAAVVDGQPVAGTGYAALPLEIPPGSAGLELVVALPEPVTIAGVAEALVVTVR